MEEQLKEAKVVRCVSVGNNARSLTTARRKGGGSLDSPYCAGGRLRTTPRSRPRRPDPWPEDPPLSPASFEAGAQTYPDPDRWTKAGASVRSSPGGGWNEKSS